ncbi:MAG: carbon-nitrogen hydrolase family protein [Gemmatimonadales bacterium]
MTVRIALAQMASSPDRADNLARALGAMDRAAEAGAQLIVFPEVALDRFFPQHERFERSAELASTIPGPVADRFAAKARQHGLVTVMNLYETDGKGRFYDSSPVYDADGTLLGVTRMIHITDYACFHEKTYYHPGDRGAPVYQTKVGRVGVAICYDRHYPEYTRALGIQGAELVAIPQAGAVGEWPEGLFEAEVRTASFQNGYYTALCNRVGQEERLAFGGESFVVDPEGQVVARANATTDELLLADLDFSTCQTSTARRLFWRDRRPELYHDWLGPAD